MSNFVIVHRINDIWSMWKGVETGSGERERERVRV